MALMQIFTIRFIQLRVIDSAPWIHTIILKGEVQSRITIISKERVKISLQIGAKIMKIG